jgi:phage gp29-like protein
MPDNRPVLYGPDGLPIKHEVLTQEIARPSLASIRSPLSGYPGDGLNPVRLAHILKEADQGDPMRYCELAETIEERDMHYVGVLATRKRSVAQLDITVDAASDDPEHVKHADMVRAWLNRDELQDEIFDMLDAIGKGISFTEIVWDTSMGQWVPSKLIWRDPRWFRFDYNDLATPLLRTNEGDVPLAPFKFVTTVIRAKSGIPIRAGIARVAAWAWMFKAFTLRDWAIFTQTYGQPIRVGKYPVGSTSGDKDTLFNAVANIAGDCAAIIPEGMNIEFIQAQNTGQGSDLYRNRADWFDQQVSKAILGQTATTDAIAGGHAVGQEHRKVQEDIERADAKSLASVLNRDLVKNWVDLEHGPQQQYPRLRIGREAEEDLQQTIDGVVKLVPLGLKVGMSTMRDKLGLPEPGDDEELLVAPAPQPTFGGGPFGDPLSPPLLNSRRPTQRTADDVAALAAAAQRLAEPAFNDMVDYIKTALQSASSPAQFRAELAKLKLDPQNMASALQLAFVMAKLAGRADIADAV